MFERVMSHRVWEQVKGILIFRALRRLRIPLVGSVVIAILSRLHGIFGYEKRRPYATSPAVRGNIVAQGASDGIGCRIVVEGVVKNKRIPSEVNDFTYCLLHA